MRRQFQTHEVSTGSVTMGANCGVLLQSMTNTSTLSIAETTAQCIRIIEAGGRLVRISAKNQKDLDAILKIKTSLRQHGYTQPLIADIHFSASLAVKAASFVEKVRINPGNFYKSDNLLSDTDYNQKIRDNLIPLLRACEKNQVSIRVGTNHGSLSERIRQKYGTGAQAMAEASMEFVRIIAETGFRNLILSVKASNALENIRATQMLAQMQNREGYTFPLHLGVTEAGLGFSGRIKSAVGIGALLADGIGDTIRVSLTESPEHEIPVAHQLTELFLPNEQTFRVFWELNNMLAEGMIQPREFVIIGKHSHPWLPGLLPDISDEEYLSHSVKVFSDISQINAEIAQDDIPVIETGGKNALYDFRKIYVSLMKNKKPRQVIWKRTIGPDKDIQLRFAAELGSLISSGVLRGCWVDGDRSMLNDAMKVLYEVLQICGLRNTHAEFISCPSCNRTSFDIMQLAEEVRSRTHHLTGMTIAVMGCIVNGPGEMGAADFGLVGQGKGLLALYRKGQLIEHHIPEKEACNRLLEEIEKNR